MKAFVGKVLLFAALVAISHVAVIALAAMASPSLKATIQKYSNVPVGMRRDHIALRFEELQGERDIDVLFIGSSHSLRTFDPRYFEREGRRAFNLGTSSQTPMNTYYLLRRYLPQLNPRVVVLEVYWEALELNGEEGAIAITVNRGPDWDTLSMALSTKSPRLLNAQWSSLFEGLFGTTTAVRLHPAEVYTSGGYLEAWDLNSIRVPRRRPGDVIVDEKQMKYLSRTVALLRAHGAKPILVWAPVTAPRRSTATNLAQVRRRLTDLSGDHGVPFVDLSDHIALDDRLDFRDDDHLNQRGVDKVMPVFMQMLREHGLLNEMTTRATVTGQ